MDSKSGGRLRASARWALLRDRLRSSIWPVPTAAIAVAVVLGVLLPELDEQADSDLPGSATRMLFGGGPEAARSVLSAIAGSLITATSLVFSLTIVALQLASTQASPRLLRLFARDRMVHATMAVFLGTFAYTLTLLRTVRTEEGDESAFVPRIGVTVASLLTLASVVMLALFLAHLARELRVETMLRAISTETGRSIARAPVSEGNSPSVDEVVRPPSAEIVVASRSGFLVEVDRKRLVELARDADLIIAEARPVGSSVIEGTPLAFWWPRTGSAWSDVERGTIANRVRHAMRLDFERSTDSDIAYGLRQLTDVALKAVSPGVNDPTTAVHALGHASALLCTIVRRPADDQVATDERGRPRVIFPALDAAELLDSTLDQLRRYGSGDREVVLRMLELLREVAWANQQAGLEDPIRAQIRLVLESANGTPRPMGDKERIQAAATAALSALGGVWMPGGPARAVLSDAALSIRPPAQREVG